MKHIFLFFIALLFFSCAVSPEKETIIREIQSNGMTIFVNKQIYPVVNTPMMSIQKSIILGNPADVEIPGSTGGNGYIDVQSSAIQEDFINANFYWNNSYSKDYKINVLDLGKFTGEKQAYVCIDALWISGGNDNTTLTIAIRAYNSPYTWQIISCRKNNPARIFELTDNTGKIEWKQLTTNPYDAITKDADPGYHSYQYATGILTAVWMTIGVGL